ncbi:hypothetical protein E4T56_gene12098 [Termitomyces sp. T112]|nr:hypothetical protein E4T56_gene12098 [Termitomyces sp. T112]
MFDFTRIPVELYRNIFQYASQKELVSLSQASHTFQKEAEDILYYQVDLQKTHKNRRLAMTWCTAVVKNERRARCVNALKFPSTFKTPLTEDFSFDIQAAIARAFNAIVNLKHLWLLGVGEKYTASLHPATLKDCTFSLLSLGGQTSSFGPEDMWEFLSRHPHLEYWAPTVPLLNAISSIPTHVVLSLRRVVLVDPSKVLSLANRPINYMCLVFVAPVLNLSAGLDAIISLRPISDTLHTLSITHGPLQNWSTLDLLLCLGSSSPHLKSLAFSTFGNVHEVIRKWNRQKIVDAISCFYRLETLVLATPTAAVRDFNEASYGQENIKNWKKTSLNPDECREVASLVIQSSKTLVRITLPFESITGTVRSLTYSRSTTDPSEAKFEGFHIISTTGWWMR